MPTSRYPIGKTTFTGVFRHHVVTFRFMVKKTQLARMTIHLCRLDSVWAHFIKHFQIKFIHNYCQEILLLLKNGTGISLIFQSNVCNKICAFHCRQRLFLSLPTVLASWQPPETFLGGIWMEFTQGPSVARPQPVKPPGECSYMSNRVLRLSILETTMPGLKRCLTHLMSLVQMVWS